MTATGFIFEDNEEETRKKLTDTIKLIFEIE